MMPASNPRVPMMPAGSLRAPDVCQLASPGVCSFTEPPHPLTLHPACMSLPRGHGAVLKRRNALVPIREQELEAPLGGAAGAAAPGAPPPLPLALGGRRGPVAVLQRVHRCPDLLHLQGTRGEAGGGGKGGPWSLSLYALSTWSVSLTPFPFP